MPTERMKRSEIKLKPCPFCGGEMCIIGSQRRFSISHKGLRNCHFYKFEIDPQTVRNFAEAIEAWNMRANKAYDSSHPFADDVLKEAEQ